MSSEELFSARSVPRCHFLAASCQRFLQPAAAGLFAWWLGRFHTSSFSPPTHSSPVFCSIICQGTVGKLLSIDKKNMQVVVEGVNVRTKHVKPMKEGESGSLVKKEMPIHMSNVALSTEQPAAPAAAE